MSMIFDLKGKTAVITGATGILCSVIAKELAKQGVNVAVLGHGGDKAKMLADEIIRDGGSAIYYNADVLNKESLIEARDYVIEKYQDIDILINGAGGNKKEATTSDELSFFDIDFKALECVFNLNVMGAVLTTQVFGELFAKSGKGCVINISSMAAYHPLTKTIAYSGAKAAVSNFTEWMAVHFNQNYSTKIRVNAVAPGFLLTNQNKYLMVQENGDPTERGKKVLDKTPMNRYGNPEEIAGPVLWLCSEAASFVNGAVIPIDGGFSSYWGV
ncbi:SDR family oxidoreductase [Sedimentibacter sp.]|uniref:SDR family oxidoreductase n=1 Tax=Sedimentibacter sp. TaxID=1960295 RepID=UPI0028B1D890|nr:SDR family oxidoreductase [Sedimentibacter sp.]